MSSPGRAQSLVRHHDAVDIDHLLPFRRVGDCQARRAVDQPKRVAGIQAIAKAVARFIHGQRPVVKRGCGLGGGVIGDQGAHLPLVKEIAYPGGMLRVSPQQGLQGVKQATHPDSGGVRFTQNFQGIRVVIGGGQPLGIER